jgi:hypothetical protein
VQGFLDCFNMNDREFDLIITLVLTIIVFLKRVNDFFQRWLFG